MSTVVLLSGGQDSVTALHWALNFGKVEGAISFDYGQRHRVELRFAKEAAEKAGLPWDCYEVPFLAAASPSSLTRGAISNTGEGRERNVYAEERDLPASFTPGRNLLFFTMGAAHAAKVGANSITVGTCAQDYAGYPDCRPDFIRSMRDTIRLGMDWPTFEIYTPMLYLSKASTWEMASDYGILDLILWGTVTCYEGYLESHFPWGYGCGVCGACVERARGYNEFMQREPQRR